MSTQVSQDSRMGDPEVAPRHKVQGGPGEGGVLTSVEGGGSYS